MHPHVSFGQRSLALLLLLALVGCAVQKVPTGGPLDRQGPRLLEASPPHETKNFKGNEVVFTFDEFLAPAVLSKELNISPPPTTPPQQYIHNKRIVVRFKEALAPNTTYNISLGAGIKDNNEKNPLSQPIAYAFTTGSYLDSHQVAGQVVFPYTGRGQKGFTVGLFHTDSVARRGFWQLRPLYLGRSDSNGNYTIGYVRPGRYVLFAFDDVDGSFSYNNASERVAYDLDDTLDLATQVQVQARDLYAYRPDTTAPLLRDVEPLHAHTLLLSFNEPVLAGSIRMGKDSVRWGYADRRHFYEDDPQRVLLTLADSLAQDSVYIQLRAVTDTLGNSRDTTLRRYVRLRPGAGQPLRITSQPRLPDASLYAFGFNSNAPLDSSTLRQHLTVVDSSDQNVPYRLQMQGAYQFHVLLPPTVDSLNTYTLAFDSMLVSRHGLAFEKRKNQSYTLNLPNPDNYGSLQGSVQYTSDNIIVSLVHTGGKLRYTSRGRAFHFKYVRPGTYTLEVLLDEDGNGQWTAGRIRPKRYSEELRFYPAPIRIRAGFSIEQYVVSVE